MDISLTKLPWYAQIGAFVRARRRRRRRLLLLLRDADSAPRWRRAKRSSTALHADIAKGHDDREEAAASSARRSTTSKARLGNLRAVLPEEKDAADLLRRMQTVATQSNLHDQELQAGARRHEAAARRVADRARARRHVSQPGDLLRPRRQVHAHREHHRRCDVAGKDQPDANATITATCVATTFVLLDKPAAAASRARRQRPPRRRRRHEHALHVSRRSRSSAASPRRRRRAAQAAGAASPRRPSRRAAAGAGRHRAAPESYTYEPTAAAIRSSTCSAAGAEPRATPQRGDGPAGLTVAEISVRGIMQSRGALIAMVQGPDNKTYIMQPGRQARSTARSRP